MTEYIVTRLREAVFNINLCHAAADEIERLRKEWFALSAWSCREIERITAERDGYLSGNQQVLRALAEANEIAQRCKRERDDARREVCELRCNLPERFIGLPHELAAINGWDCFMEVRDGR
jgi:hypothetical protein